MGGRFGGKVYSVTFYEKGSGQGIKKSLGGSFSNVLGGRFGRKIWEIRFNIIRFIRGLEGIGLEETLREGV